jgi:hypothetical protein
MIWIIKNFQQFFVILNNQNQKFKINLKIMKLISKKKRKERLILQHQEVIILKPYLLFLKINLRQEVQEELLGCSVYLK